MPTVDQVVGGPVTYSDEVYALELWRPSTDPPYLTAPELPAFEGGLVGSVAANVVTLSSAWQAIDPTQRGVSAEWVDVLCYQTSLTKSHAGRQCLVRTLDPASALNGLVFEVASSSAMGLTLTAAGQPADLHLLTAGDQLVLCDRLEGLEPHDDRSIERLAASFTHQAVGQVGSLADGTAGRLFDLVQPGTWLYWRSRCGTPADGQRPWFDCGWYIVTDLNDPLADKQGRCGLTALDPLGLLTSQNFQALYQADALKPWQMQTGTAPLTVLVPIWSPGSGAVGVTGNPAGTANHVIDSTHPPAVILPGGNTTGSTPFPLVLGDEGEWIFVDSPVGTADEVILSPTLQQQALANHTMNWQQDCPPLFYLSNDEDKILTGSTDGSFGDPSPDQPMPLKDGMEVMYGEGMLRIKASVFNDYFRIATPGSGYTAAYNAYIATPNSTTAAAWEAAATSSGNSFTSFNGLSYHRPPRIKCCYSRWANSADRIDATIAVGGISYTAPATTLTLATASGAPLPGAGAGLQGLTLRLESGAARWLTFTIQGSTAIAGLTPPPAPGGTVTVNADLLAYGVQAGDQVSLIQHNDPQGIVADLLRRVGFQTLDPTRPLYLDHLDLPLLPATVQSAWAGPHDGTFPTGPAYPSTGTLTDVTTALQCGLSPTSLLHNVGDCLYLGLGAITRWLWLDIAAGWSGGAYALEYYASDSTWKTLTLTEDGTVVAGQPLGQTGLLGWAPPPASLWGLQTLTYTSPPGPAPLLFCVRLRVTTAPAAALQLNRATFEDVPMAPSPTEYQTQEGAKPAACLDMLRSNGLLAPNWILRCREDGVTAADNVLQKLSPDWLFTRQSGVRRQRSDKDIYTAAYYTGVAEDATVVSNPAVNPGASIHECVGVGEPLHSLLTRNPLYPVVHDITTACFSVYRGWSSDFIALRFPPMTSYQTDVGGQNWDLAPQFLIDGSDYKLFTTSTRIPWPSGYVGPSGCPGYWPHRWSYTTRNPLAATVVEMATLDNVPLWYVDLGVVMGGLNEVDLYVDGYHCDTSYAASASRITDPYGRLEVVPAGPGDTRAYSDLGPADWVPLCAAANGFDVSRKGEVQFQFTGGQSSFRYLRYVSVSAGMIQTTGNNYPMYDTGYCVSIQIMQTGNLAGFAQYGQTGPFADSDTATPTYANLYRRFGKRYFISKQPDPGASSMDYAIAKAIDNLRELSIVRPQIPITGFRPEATLGQTVGLIRPEYHLLPPGRPHLIVGLSRGAAGHVDVKLQDFSL